LFQQVDGVIRFLPLPEPHAGVEQQHGDDDSKVIPAMNKRGDNCRDFDHHGNGPPKEPEEFQDGVAFLFGNFI
jgi:hypothetical protein